MVVSSNQNISPLDVIFDSERLPQANLLLGPSGLGKKTNLLKKIGEQFCLSQKAKPCGECGPCVRLKQAESEFHLLIAPDDSGAIKVDDIRKIKRVTSLQTVSKKFFIIIDDADTMTLQSCNALLKILEEPTKGCYFFLITAHINQLPATIRSRTQVLRFSQPSFDRSQMSGVNEWSAKLGRTELDLVKALESLMPERDQIVSWLQNLVVGRSFKSNIQIDKNNFEAFIFFLKSLIRDSLFLKMGLSHKILNSELTALVELLAQQNEMGLHETYEQLDKYQKWSAENVDRNLIIDNIAYKFGSFSHV